MNYKWLIAWFNYWRSGPVYFLATHSKFSEKVKKDISVWRNKNMATYTGCDLNSFAYMMMDTKEFRNVILNRTHRNPISFMVSRILFKPLESLYINMPPENIGGGLYFQHGFATVIAAKKIGENCSINQQVTVGYNGDEAPVIGDNVVICVGAIVIGNVVIGNNSIVGAGAVVTHDVDEGIVVAGVPAKKIRTV